MIFNLVVLALTLKGLNKIWNFLEISRILFHIYSWKTVKSAYPINSFKEKRFSQKTSASLGLRFVNISRLHIGMCQLDKPPANEITEPLAFTAELCKILSFAEKRWCRSHVPGEIWHILPSVWIKFLGFLFWSWLCFAFYSWTFLCSGAFHDDESIWFRKRDHGWSVNKKIWNMTP